MRRNRTKRERNQDVTAHLTTECQLEQIADFLLNSVTGVEVTVQRARTATNLVWGLYYNTVPMNGCPVLFHEITMQR